MSIRTERTRVTLEDILRHMFASEDVFALPYPLRGGLDLRYIPPGIEGDGDARVVLMRTGTFPSMNEVAMVRKRIERIEERSIAFAPDERRRAGAYWTIVIRWTPKGDR